MKAFRAAGKLVFQVCHSTSLNFGWCYSGRVLPLLTFLTGNVWEIEASLSCSVDNGFISEQKLENCATMAVKMTSRFKGWRQGVLKLGVGAF